jgi:hypothetical protein
MATKKTVHDLLARSADDPEFARKLIVNPAQFKDEYELTEEEMKAISGAGQAALKGHAGAATEDYEGKVSIISVG